jgi:putative ABC transport system permease protein
MVLMELEPMEHYRGNAPRPARDFQLLLIGVFAAIAAILAGVGLYGVLATLVAAAYCRNRRPHGAGRRAPASIFQLIVGQGLRLSAAGILVGLAAASRSDSVMTSMLIGVKPGDPLTYAVMAVVFFAIAALARGCPPVRAAALDPTVALRGE